MNPNKITFESIYSGKTSEQIKNEVLIDLYNTGRIKKRYMGKYSDHKANPVKEYIKMYLKLNGLNDTDNELCEECYQTAFTYLFSKTPEQIKKMLEAAPNGSWLNALLCRIIINQCFAIKPNPKSSGIVHNIINNSAYGNYQVSSNENLTDDREPGELIIYDEPDTEYFESKYGLTIEDFIEQLPNEDREFFYQLMGKQPVGKPSNQFKAKREEFYDKLKGIKDNLPKNN